MTNEIDNPKLTAFALGELDDAERNEIETLLRRSPEARRWVDEVRATASALQAELRVASEFTLNADQRTALVNAIGAPRASERSSPLRGSVAPWLRGSPTNRSLALAAPMTQRLRRYWIPTALAASLVMAAGTAYWIVDFLAGRESSPATVVSSPSVSIDHGEPNVVAVAMGSTLDVDDLAAQPTGGPDARTPRPDEQFAMGELERSISDRVQEVSTKVLEENESKVTSASEQLDVNGAVHGCFGPQIDLNVNLASTKLPEKTSTGDGAKKNEVFATVPPQSDGTNEGAPNIGLKFEPVTDLRNATARASGGSKPESRGGPNAQNSPASQDIAQLSTIVNNLELERALLDKYRRLYDNPEGAARAAEDRTLDVRIEALSEQIAELRTQEFAEEKADRQQLVNTAYMGTQQSLAFAQELLAKRQAELAKDADLDSAIATVIWQPGERHLDQDSDPQLGEAYSYAGGMAAVADTTLHTLRSVSQPPSDIPGSFGGQMVQLPASFNRLGFSPAEQPHATYAIKLPVGQFQALTDVEESKIPWTDSQRFSFNGNFHTSDSVDFKTYRNISYGYGAPSAPSHIPDARMVGGFYDSVDPRAAESYPPLLENPFLFVEHQPLSTFSIDVDTASYANVRRYLNGNQLPPPGAVRIEEMINYFDYAYPPPSGPHPFSVGVEVAECPWQPEHRLARIGIKGKEFTERTRPAANLVFLIDVSGSMMGPERLPLVKQGLRLLVEELAARDSVAIVTYAGESGIALTPTSARDKQTILSAIDALHAGGSTNGGAGIEQAYELANENFVEGGANRVILATDGDFNIGVTQRDQLTKLIEDKAKSGVFLSVLGFGMGSFKDGTLETLADRGNGNYAYIDNIDEANKVLVGQIDGTLITIAKDVKIQVEFNPTQVSAYRLIGYENRMLRAQDFNDDKKDAGEIGAGHTVTALYEIVPAGMAPETPGVDPLKYQKSERRASAPDPVQGQLQGNKSAEDTEDAEFVEADRGSNSSNDELMTVKLRYKHPEGDESALIEMPVVDTGLTLDDASADFGFAAAVASFGMLLRGSAHVDGLTFDAVSEMAQVCIGQDPFDDRAEFISLVEKAQFLTTNP